MIVFNLQNAMEDNLLIRVLVLMVPVWLLILGYFLCQGVQIILFIDYLKGKKTNLAQAWTGTIQRFWSLCYLACLVWTTSLIAAVYRWLSTGGQRDNSGINLVGNGFFATILNATAAAILSVLVPVIIQENLSPGPALKRAWQLHSKANQVMDIVIVETGSRTLERLWRIIMILVLWPIFILVYDFASAGMIMALFCLLVPMMVLLATFKLYVYNSLYASIYLAALEIEQETKLAVKENPISQVLTVI
jgi:hypothetical protein